MSNIDVQNMRYGLDRKKYKILGMSQKNYMGTYDFIVRQTINYEKKSNGKDSDKYISVISNQEGNYIDYIKGRKNDLDNLSYGRRCVFIKNSTLITGAGSDPKVVLTFLKLKAVSKILINLILFIMIIYFSYKLIIIYI